MPNFRPFFALIIALPCCLAATNVTLAPPNDSLVFSSGWEADAARQFFFLDDLGTALSATLPGSASHIYYVGFKLPQGSAYGFCVDCNAQGDLSSTQVVDGQDPSLSDDTRTPVVLFSAPLESSSNHDLTVLNLPDDRFGGVSRIIFISLLVTVEGDVETTAEQPTLMPSFPATSATLSTSASSSPSLSLSIVSSSQSATVSSTNPQASAGGANAPTASVSSSLIAVIVVLSAVAVLSLLLGLFVFFRKRHRRIRATRRQSEPLSFKDRPMSEFSGKPLSTDSGVGPLAAAGRIPPARRDLNSLVQNQWRPMPPVPGSTGSPVGLSPNRWVSSRDQV